MQQRSATPGATNRRFNLVGTDLLVPPTGPTLLGAQRLYKAVGLHLGGASLGVKAIAKSQVNGRFIGHGLGWKPQGWGEQSWQKTHGDQEFRSTAVTLEEAHHLLGFELGGVAGFQL